MEKNMPALAMSDLISQETGEVRPLKYREGSPRNYRFDASKGIVNINGETAITKPGDHFTFIPVACRIFKDTLFQAEGQTGLKKWGELFFVNEASVLCAIMVHGYTVENLEKLEAELFYDDLSLNQVALTLKPVQKENKTVASKYYIGEWGYKAAPKDLVAEFAGQLTGVPVYREDTWKETAELLVTLNYAVPVNALPPGESAPALPETVELQSKPAK